MEPDSMPPACVQSTAPSPQVNHNHETLALPFTMQQHLQYELCITFKYVIYLLAARGELDDGSAHEKVVLCRVEARKRGGLHSCKSRTRSG